jgi:SAM-dependent methyltransferase
MQISRLPDVAPESGPEPLNGNGPDPTARKDACVGSRGDQIALDENPWGYGKRLRFVVEAITTEYRGRPLASVRVLDVGCGNGSLLAIPLAGGGFDVTGIDLHRPSIERARRIAVAMPNARFIAGPVTDLTEPPFDVVILSEVLEHVFDPRALLLASLEHLKPGGIVVITVPNGYGEFEIDSWIFRTFHLGVAADFLKWLLRNGSAESVRGDQPDMPATDNENCPHLQFFRRRRLKQMFRECSLALVRESAGSFACGPLVCHALGRSRRFIEWNARVVDKLPLPLASSWYFVLRRATESSL